MKVIHLCTTDIKGGAHRSAYRLHQSLLQMGLDSTIWVAEKRTDDPTVRSIKLNWFEYLNSRLRWRHLPIKFIRYWNSRPEGYTVFSDHRSLRGKALMKSLPDCDLINLHWVSGFVDFPLFFRKVPSKMKLVWTLHDMNAFTGGCHYALDCDAFTAACGACPQLGSNNPRDISNSILNQKKEVYRGFESHDSRIIAPSHWMKKQVQGSTLLNRFPISVIPYGVDLEVFLPHDPNQSRLELNLPLDKKIILFVANAVKIMHKGFEILVRALEQLGNSEGILLVSLGSGKPVMDASVPHLHLGHFRDNHQIAKVYSAADIFVIPSLQDNLPNTVLESLACGTPVIGFDVGGIPDMVRPGVTGLLVPPKDEESLGDAIQTLLQNDALRAQMSENCRRIAVNEYALDIQAKRYIELYQEVLQSTGGPNL